VPHRITKTAEQQILYNNTVIGTLAVDGWAVTFGYTMMRYWAEPQPVSLLLNIVLRF